MISFIIGLIIGILIGAGGLILVTMVMMIDVESKDSLFPSDFTDWDAHTL